MSKSHSNSLIVIEEDEEDNYTETEDSDSEDIDSDNSEEDPSYTHHDLHNTRSKLTNLSINSRDIHEIDEEEEEVTDVEEVRAPNLRIKDVKNLEEIQRVIDCGLVEKLKVEQCKVYLRTHGLRLTGKKDILIQRIKEHSEIVNGGGEKKFPVSSFVLNCKGDACMGDIVMFEQTVYEGFNIASRSATGPPCGKRTVAGRIVKESYGAAKQQHTFTVEVLWSKGHKPLPPLHPLLIKGRNLYRLNTLRQRWEDESERQRVLNEKHSRGFIARSNREVRIQEKNLRKTMLKGSRVCSEGQHSHQEKNHKSNAQKQSTVAKKTQQPQTNEEQNLTVPVENKENSYAGFPNSQPSQQNKPNMLPSYLHQVPTSRVCLANKDQNSYAGLPKSQPSQQNKPNVLPSYLHQVPTSRVCLANKDQNSSLSHIIPPIFQHSRPAETTFRPLYGFVDKYQQMQHHPRQLHYSVQPHSLQQKTSSSSTCHFNQKPNSCFSDNGNFVPSASTNMAFSYIPQQPHHESCSAIVSNRSFHDLYGRNHQKQPQQLCRHYPLGKCYYGDRCKFSHVSNRN